MGFRDVQRCNIVIDFSNQVWGSYFATEKKDMTNDDGINVGCIIGFVKVICMAIGKVKQLNMIPRLVICEDRVPIRKRLLYQNAVHLMRKTDATYKGTRPKKDIPYDPVKICKQYMQCLPHTVVWCDGEEADDVIATYVTEHPGANIVISTDKDIWQLFDIPNLVILTGLEKEELTEELIQKRFDGGTYKQVVLHKCIRGDSGDNVQGIFRYQFKKTVKSFIRCNGTIKDYARCLREDSGKDSKEYQQIKDNVGLLVANKKIVRLETDLILQKNVYSQHNADSWRKLCYSYQTPSLLNMALLTSL